MAPLPTERVIAVPPPGKDVMSDLTRIAIKGPIDLIAVVPHVLGFEPTDGRIVVIGFEPGAMAASIDVGGLMTHECDAIVDAMTEPLLRNGVDAAAIVGYGEIGDVGVICERLGNSLTASGVHVLDVIRVAGGRYYTMGSPGGGETASDGVAFDASTTAAAAMLVFLGSAAFPSRQALADQFRPVTGPERANMRAATSRAVRRHRRLAASAGEHGDSVQTAGRHAVAGMYRRHHSGRRLSDDDAAWITVLLTDSGVRNHILRHTHSHRGHFDLWTDLTRRAAPDFAAAPATILALTAWQMGDGVIAGIAVERALEADPTYRLARLVELAVRVGIPPTSFDGHVGSADDPLTAPGGSAE